MKKVFDENWKEFDRWYDKHKYAYLSELEAVKKAIPEEGDGIEIGVGTGRFSVPLGIRVGVEPSAAMAEVAGEKGVEVIEAVAENLPIKDEEYDYAVILTTICFLDEPEKGAKEIYRILKPGGKVIVGFVDKDSPIGVEYAAKKGKSKFYKDARFFSVKEIVELLKKAGFSEFSFLQTLFRRLGEIDSVEPVKEGCGEGSFVVVSGLKKI